MQKEAADRYAEVARKKALERAQLLDRMVAEAKAWLHPGHAEETVRSSSSSLCLYHLPFMFVVVIRLNYHCCLFIFHLLTIGDCVYMSIQLRLEVC